MKVRCRDLGLTDFADCWALQRTLFDALLAQKTARAAEKTDAAAADANDADNAAGTNNATGADDAVGTAEAAGANEKNPAEDNSDDAGTVLLTEHRPVYTLGKSGRAENLLVGRSVLEAMGARFFHIDRGGDVTFHGPGQLVCYPILDLERLGIGLREYIGALEEAVIRTVAHFGIRAGRIAGASGVWIDPEAVRPRKICAIGVRSSRYVTMHGFALNVSTDLGWFARINPCGFTDRGVTSIAAETGENPDMERVKALVIENLSEILNVKIYNNQIVCP